MKNEKKYLQCSANPKQKILAARMKKLHYRKEKFLTVTIYKIHSVSVAIFKKINLKFYFLKGIRVHPNKRTYAPIGCTRSVLATV